MVGKRVNDTTTYYQIEIPFNENKQPSYENSEEVELNPIREVNKYQKYIDKHALTLSDSIYNLVWGNPKNQINMILL